MTARIEYPPGSPIHQWRALTGVRKLSTEGKRRADPELARRLAQLMPGESYDQILAWLDGGYLPPAEDGGRRFRNSGAEMLRQLIDRKVSQEEVAHTLCLSPKTLTLYLAGTNVPDGDIRRAMASAYPLGPWVCDWDVPSVSRAMLRDWRRSTAEDWAKRVVASSAARYDR